MKKCEKSEEDREKNERLKQDNEARRLKNETTRLDWEDSHEGELEHDYGSENSVAQSAPQISLKGKGKAVDRAEAPIFDGERTLAELPTLPALERILIKSEEHYHSSGYSSFPSTTLPQQRRRKPTPSSPETCNTKIHHPRTYHHTTASILR